MLPPQEAATLLEQRADTLRKQLASLEADLAAYSATLPRIVLMDDEYRRAITAAELAWIDSVVADLRAGTWTWGYEEFADLARSVHPDIGQLMPPA
jgi:hypothetical protein